MDIFILAGQSNMAGRGNTRELPAEYIAVDRQGEFESYRINTQHVHCEQQVHWYTLVYDTRYQRETAMVTSACPGVTLNRQSEQTHVNTWY